MFISDHELTKSDAVDGMFLAKVGKKKITEAMSMDSSTQLNHETSVPPTETI